MLLWQNGADAPEELLPSTGESSPVMAASRVITAGTGLALAWGAASQTLQPLALAIAVIGGITISMVPSLIIPPAVHFYLSRER